MGWAAGRAGGGGEGRRGAGSLDATELGASEIGRGGGTGRGFCRQNALCKMPKCAIGAELLSDMVRAIPEWDGI